jgi:hypothetical protein
MRVRSWGLPRKWIGAERSEFVGQAKKVGRSGGFIGGLLGYDSIN